ncbi:MAG: carbohydrate binding domain-containing protein [Candidatus Poribacteria bacterium]
MVRRYLLLLFFVSMCFIITGTHTAWSQAKVENLVKNEDFENVNDAPWTMWVEDAAAAATKTIDKKEFRTGKYSLLIDITKAGGGKRVELHQNPFNLKANQKLIYAFWAKVDKERTANMICNHRADPWTGYGSKAITITDVWTEFWVEVTIPANDALVGIYVELKDSVGKTWFDHFRFYEGKYIVEDLDGKPKAVESQGKVATTWAEIKH